MNVLFVVPNLFMGGAERHLSILMPGLVRRGFDARLIALDGGGPFEEHLRHAGIPVEVLAMRNQADLGPVLRSETVRRFVPAAIVSSGGVSGLYIGSAIARWRRAVNIYNEHRGARLSLSRRREAMIRLVARHLDAVIAVSEDQSGVWLARGYPRERLVVIPNGVPAAAPTASRLAMREELGLPGAAFAVLLVARLHPEKRVLDFVRAILAARATHPKLVGLIAGEGPDRVDVEAAVGDSDAVRLLGYRKDVANIYAAVDVVAMSSAHEATPMAILEAMAAGLPVVATNVGGVPRIVEDGVTGLLVPAGDPQALASALQRLADQPDLRRAMGAAASQRHGEHWSADTMVDRYARELRERVAAAARGSAER